MKIITVNLQQEVIDTIETLIGNEGLYPSRSELIRVAVRDFLIQELNQNKKIQEYKDVMDGDEPKSAMEIALELQQKKPLFVRKQVYEHGVFVWKMVEVGGDA